jgi:hypothetical protein
MWLLVGIGIWGICALLVLSLLYSAGERECLSPENH